MRPSSLARPSPGTVRPIPHPSKKNKILTSSSTPIVRQQWSYLWSGNMWVISDVSSISSKLQQAALDKPSKLLITAGRVGMNHNHLFLFPHPILFLNPPYSFPITSQSEIIKKKKQNKTVLYRYSIWTFLSSFPVTKE